MLVSLLFQIVPIGSTDIPSPSNKQVHLHPWIGPKKNGGKASKAPKEV